ncbi:MAG: pYEATS domain-containing protein [Burkholderiales bacterium]
MSNDSQRSDYIQHNEFAKSIQLGLILIAGISVICALLRSFYPDRFDEKTAMFLVVAVVALMIHQITKFKGFGIEFEKKVDQLSEDVKSVEAAFGNLEKDLGPGSKTSVTPTAAATPVVAVTASPDALPLDADDPNKRQFGNSPAHNGRKLSATIKPLAGTMSSRCQVNISVVSTDPARPLVGKVKLHLHPTFGRWSTYDLDVKGGVAEDNIVSYGAFTIGVEADDGKTRLELDLMDMPGGTKRFYEE